MESCIEDLDGNMREKIALIDEVRKDIEKVMKMCQGFYGKNSLSKAACPKHENLLFCGPCGRE